MPEFQYNKDKRAKKQKITLTNDEIPDLYFSKMVLSEFVAKFTLRLSTKMVKVELMESLIVVEMRNTPR